MKLTFVSKIVSLTEASPINVGAESSAILATVTGLKTILAIVIIATAETVSSDMVAGVTNVTSTMATAQSSIAPRWARLIARGSHVSWQTRAGSV